MSEYTDVHTDISEQSVKKTFSIIYVTGFRHIYNDIKGLFLQ